MTIQVIRAWISKLPPYELDMPIVVYNGVAYTPRAVLDEVMRRTTIGEQLQKQIEMGIASLHQEDEEELAKLRLKLMLSKPTTTKIVALTYPQPTVLSPQDILREIEQGTPRGRLWINAQKEVINRLLRMR
ncbi:MAG: hypothetical protein QXW80_02710 [Candidatus Micrarchaeia archaeon]